LRRLKYVSGGVISLDGMRSVVDMSSTLNAPRVPSGP
jgi:hypothetical protein